MCNLSYIFRAYRISQMILLSTENEKIAQRSARIFKRLAYLNLKAKPKKCIYLQEEIHFYGLIFTENGARPDPARPAHA